MKRLQISVLIAALLISGSAMAMTVKQAANKACKRICASKKTECKSDAQGFFKLVHQAGNSVNGAVSTFVQGDMYKGYKKACKKVAAPTPARRRTTPKRRKPPKASVKKLLLKKYRGFFDTKTTKDGNVYKFTATVHRDAVKRGVRHRWWKRSIRSTAEKFCRQTKSQKQRACKKSMRSVLRHVVKEVARDFKNPTHTRDKFLSIGDVLLTSDGKRYKRPKGARKAKQSARQKRHKRSQRRRRTRRNKQKPSAPVSNRCSNKCQTKKQAEKLVEAAKKKAKKKRPACKTKLTVSVSYDSDSQPVGCVVYGLCDAQSKITTKDLDRNVTWGIGDSKQTVTVRQALSLCLQKVQGTQLTEAALKIYRDYKEIPAFSRVFWSQDNFVSAVKKNSAGTTGYLCSGHATVVTHRIFFSLAYYKSGSKTRFNRYKAAILAENANTVLAEQRQTSCGQVLMSLPGVSRGQVSGGINRIEMKPDQRGFEVRPRAGWSFASIRNFAASEMNAGKIGQVQDSLGTLRSQYGQLGTTIAKNTNGVKQNSKDIADLKKHRDYLNEASQRNRIHAYVSMTFELGYKYGTYFKGDFGTLFLQWDMNFYLGHTGIASRFSLGGHIGFGLIPYLQGPYKDLTIWNGGVQLNFDAWRTADNKRNILIISLYGTYTGEGLGSGTDSALAQKKGEDLTLSLGLRLLPFTGKVQGLGFYLRAGGGYRKGKVRDVLEESGVFTLHAGMHWRL